MYKIAVLIILLESSYAGAQAITRSGSKTLSTRRQIHVGRNILVTRDGRFNHLEPSIASDPADPKVLLVASMTELLPTGDTETKVYSSHDGGNTWLDVSFPEERAYGGGDVQLGFGIDGTAYFTAISFSEGGDPIRLHRSRDGGFTWPDETGVLVGYGDHPQLVIDDNPSSRYTGRIYIVALGKCGGEDELCVYRSEDFGRTFLGPARTGVFFHTSDSEWIQFNCPSLLILEDGTLMVTYDRFPQNRKGRLGLRQRTFAVESHDGGLTFGRLHQLFDRGWDDSLDASPQVAVFATDRRGEWKGRLYSAFTSCLDALCRIFVSVSFDGGTAWSKPVELDSNVANHSRQFLPAIAVNDLGVVGISWLDTRASTSMKSFDEYFAASVDGGHSFLPAVKVSSMSSTIGEKLSGELHSTVRENGDKTKDLRVAHDLGSRFAGSDYVGMAVDSRGIFHPVWPDSRTGTYMIETVPISVDDEYQTRETLTALPRRSERDVSSLTKLVVLEPKLSSTADLLEVPIRIKNISNDIIYPPLKVKIVFSTRSTCGIASNAISAGYSGATVQDYSDAMPTPGELKPGETTAAVVWQIKRRPNLVPLNVRLRVTGAIQDRRKSIR